MYSCIKIVPDWFVTSKMIEIPFTTLYTDENILYFNEDSGNVVFNCNGMGILNVDFDNVNLDNILTMMKMILILLFLSEFWPRILNLKNAKHLKKN